MGLVAAETVLTPGRRYVAELEVEHAKEKAARVERPWWTPVAALIGGAAGFGVVLVGMGAIVMWVRLMAAGVSVEQGLAAVPTRSLAVTGADVLLVPILFMVVTMIGLHYWLDLRLRHDLQAVEAGGAPSELLGRTRSVGKKANTWLEHAVESMNAHPLRWLPLWPLYPLVKLSELLGRYRLTVLWWVAAFPLVPGWIGLFVFNALAWRWANHVYETAHMTEKSLMDLRLRVITGFAVAAVLVSLAFQFDKPSRLAPTRISLTSGRHINGLYVGGDSDALTVAVGHTLKVIPRSQISSTEVEQIPAGPPAKSLEARIVEAIF